MWSTARAGQAVEMVVVRVMRVAVPQVARVVQGVMVMMAAAKVAAGIGHSTQGSWCGRLAAQHPRTSVRSSGRSGNHPKQRSDSRWHPQNRYRFRRGNRALLAAAAMVDLVMTAAAAMMDLVMTAAAAMVDLVMTAAAAMVKLVMTAAAMMAAAKVDLADLELR
jgi:hypothetical protein